MLLQKPVDDIPRVRLIPALGWRAFRRPRRLLRLRPVRLPLLDVRYDLLLDEGPAPSPELLVLLVEDLLPGQ
jgi:hypothetical protein